MKSKLLIALSAFNLLFITSCTFLPSSGPSGYKIRKQAGKTKGQPGFYQLVQIDQEAISKLDSFSSKGACFDIQERCPQSTLFQHAGLENLDRGSSQKIHPGDILSIVIFEAQGGLYHPINPEGAGGTPVTELPNQRIDQDGMINIPFAGSLKALGKTTKELEEEIKRILTGKTTDPQVVVNISGRGGGDLITIAGDVERPTGVPVTLAGTRIVDAIAASGGSQTRPHAVLVSVTRGSASRFDTLQAIYDNPSKNIYLNPGDTVLLRNIPLTCMVFGASGMIATLPILYDDLNLAQIMGSTGGLVTRGLTPQRYLFTERNLVIFLRLWDAKISPRSATKSQLFTNYLLISRGDFFMPRITTVRL